MVKVTATYEGEKHCEVIHGPSQSKISTDAPKDNAGKGELFSPTDLIAASLGSCILTTMAIHHEKDGIDIKNAYATVEKEMAANPRRISKLIVHLHLPKNLSAEAKQKLETSAESCPVKKSLHPDLEVPLQFHYTL